MDVEGTIALIVVTSVCIGMLYTVFMFFHKMR